MENNVEKFSAGMDQLVFLDFDNFEDDGEKDLLLSIIDTRARNPDVQFPWNSHVALPGFHTANSSSLNVFASPFQSTSYMCGEICSINESSVNTDSLNHNAHSMAAAVQPFRVDQQCVSFTPAHIIQENLNGKIGNRNDSIEYGIIQDGNDHCEKVIPLDHRLVTDNVFHDVSTPLIITDQHSDYIGSIISKESILSSQSVPVDSLVESFDEDYQKKDILHENNNDKWSKLEKPPSSEPVPLRSFADVLRNKTESKNPDVTNLKTDISHFVPLKSKVFSSKNYKSCTKEDVGSASQLGHHLYNYQVDFSDIFLQPRGLINKHNWCYINAPLQALLACCPFYSLVKNLPINPNREGSSTPVIDSVVSLAYEFERYHQPQQELILGTPFEPINIYKMMGVLKSDCVEGKQEDAEEFLSYIINGIHDEMVQTVKLYKTNCQQSNDFGLAKCNDEDIEDNNEEEWQVIGTKKKSMVIRKVFEEKTPVSDLLGGQLKSLLTTVGSRTASVQPFFTLQLDIQSENIRSIEDALMQMTKKQLVQGYVCSKTKQEVQAYNQFVVQKLPPVLILHLKRFIYNSYGGCKKIMKQTSYPLILELKKDLLSHETRKNRKMHTYKLFAVVYHDGEEAVKGHYISDVYSHGANCWIRCDDRCVRCITESHVLSHNPPRVPYLLFYQIYNDGKNSAALV